ncbi:MAG TPA: ABC transporter permease [Vicinamibacterales bacterium]|jgi:predicted permease|nr:ABC transporter permease [Vicinamibacterales bacterium]
MLDTLRQDLRQGWRMFRKNPGFAAVAITSIALGVGANAAMFSLADGLVLRPLPVPRPSEIVTIDALAPGVGFRNPRLSYPEYVDVRDQSRSFEGLVAYTLTLTSFARAPRESVQRRAGMAVSGNLFDAMGVRPRLGRTFRPDEDRVGGRNPVVILDHDEWSQDFASDPGIVDRHIRLGGIEFTVIGVAPAGFTGIDHDVHPAFYVPLAMWTAIQSGLTGDEMTRRDAAAAALVVKGRLKPGVTIAQARADVQHVAANLADAHPETNRGRGLTARTQIESFNQRPGGDTQLVTMLLTLAAAVLLVACANVAGLLASRAPARAREFAVRLAAGAPRFRLIRQLLNESLLIAVGGSVLGLFVAYGAVAIFQRLEFPTDIPLKLTFALDTRALTVGIAAALVSAMLASLIPSWQATRTDLVGALKDRTPASTASRHWGRNVLVSGQVALSLVLLTVSVFLYRAFQTELQQGPGFRTDHLLMMTFDPSLARYDAAQSRQFYRTLTERALGVPGVTSVALTSAVPMKADTMEPVAVAPEGFTFPPGTENVNVLWGRVDERYFDTLGIPLVAGRGFTATDTEETPHVAVVNATFAARYWPNQNPIGKRIRLDDRARDVVEVVGVARDIKNLFIAMPAGEFIYVPRLQQPGRQTTLLVQTAGDAAAMASPIREAIQSIDANMPVFGVRTMEHYYFSRAVYTTRLIVGSVGCMAAMGLTLALIGLYGLVAYSTGRRTREIGIRMAVGAQPWSVLRMVLRQGLVLSATGVAVGLVASVATGGLLRSAFPTQGSIDLVTYLLVVPGLIGVTLAAAYIPARWAAAIDPVDALRAE